MHNRDYVDLGGMLDRIFKAAENLGDVFEPGFAYQFKQGGPGKDFYSAYTFPPANIYMVADRTMVFEFALAGYNEADITLEFQGDYMVLSVDPPESLQDEENLMFFNRRLKYSRIKDQKYYVPDDKFDREQAKAVYKNGILRVTVSPRDEVPSQPGVKIRIVNEDE